MCLQDKILSIIVPVYNTEQYLKRCLDSLLISRLDILEVLVIIDGSPDNSYQIALEYSSKYPDTFVVVNKENGGHGSTINKGIELAKGKYFRVLDSDDWFDIGFLDVFIEKIMNTNVDMILTSMNNVYYYENRITSSKIDLVVDNHYCTKDFNFKGFVGAKLITLATVTYKTSIIRDSKLNLPHNTFYVDNLYCYNVLYKVVDFKFFDLPIYQYFIGREGQSISNDVYMKNISHLLKVLDGYFAHYMRVRDFIPNNLSDWHRSEIIFKVNDTISRVLRSRQLDHIVRLNSELLKYIDVCPEIFKQIRIKYILMKIAQNKLVARLDLLKFFFLLKDRM